MGAEQHLILIGELNDRFIMFMFEILIEIISTSNKSMQWMMVSTKGHVDTMVKLQHLSLNVDNKNIMNEG